MCLRFSLWSINEAKIKYRKVLRLLWSCLAIAARGGGRAVRGRRASTLFICSSNSYCSRSSRHTVVCQEPWQQVATCSHCPETPQMFSYARQSFFCRHVLVLDCSKPLVYIICSVLKVSLEEVWRFLYPVLWEHITVGFSMRGNLDSKWLISWGLRTTHTHFRWAMRTWMWSWCCYSLRFLDLFGVG